jgi:polyphosphate kinase
MAKGLEPAVRRRVAAVRAPVPLDRPPRLLNRELSWLDFDLRVHEAAADAGLPLLERVKLCSIVASNLDEFFAVRIAALELNRTADGSAVAKVHAQARARVRALGEAQDALWLDELRPRLARAGIPVVAPAECGPRPLRVLGSRFQREVQPLLTPIAVGVGAPFPLVPSLALNIAAAVRDPETRERRFVRVNVPSDVPRFVDVGRGLLVPLEEAIVHFLPLVVGVGEVESHLVFRATRAADVARAEEVDDLVEELERQLEQRRFGEVVRLEVSAGAPRELVSTVLRELRCRADQVYESRAPLGLRALLELTERDRPELKDEAWRPVTPRSFARRSPSELLARIRRRDVLVQHPYESFEASVETFAAAARDPKVTAVKKTVYRTGNPSPMLTSLVDAAAEDKQALCVVELQARFDERRNIEWARALEQAGVDVIFGLPELKVHTKLALLVRRERGGVRRYVHIGTGNYHAARALVFEDLSLFTADEAIGADVADVFNAITGRSRPGAFRKLLVGPWFLRDGIVDEIERVADAATAGETARIRIKVNSLADPEIAGALYAASGAGVDVEVVTRGICILRPGVPGLSERITVRSVLGRFLEHSRILSFQAGDRVATWIGSADLMPRNLDRRIEVLAPVEDARLRADVAGILDALEADTRLAWTLGADGAWRRVEPPAGARPVSAQEVLMRRALKRAKKRP